MFIDEFVSKSKGRYTIVYYDEDVVGIRYSFAILYDKFEERYLVSMFETKRGYETAYGISYENIESNLQLIKTSTDIEKLAITKIPFFDDNLIMFRNFIDESKDIKTAFNLLRKPLLQLYNHINENALEIDKNFRKGNVTLFKLGKFQLTFTLDTANPTYYEIHLGFLKKMVKPLRSATSSYPLLKVYNDKNVVVNFTEPNILYHLYNLKCQYVYNKSFIGRMKRLIKFITK